jgi:two-component system sensor histidine kinase KdpD
MKNHTILVIDNQTDVTRDLSGILCEEGYCTFTAGSPAETLEKLKKNSIDLIILDYSMKKILVEEAINKAGKSYSPPACIIITSREEAGEELSSKGEDGFYWFLPESWEREMLLFTVRNALQYGDLISRSRAFLETMSVLAAKDFSLEEKLRKMLQLSLEQINAEKGSIMLRDNQGDLIVKAASNRRLVGMKRLMEEEKTVSAWVVKNGKPLFVGNINKDSRFNPADESIYKTENFLCIPIKNEKGFVIGVFNATDRRDKRRFTKEDENVLSAFMGRIVVLIENAQLKDELEEEKKQLKSKNEELLALEQMRDDLINMIVHDLKGPLGEVMSNLDLLSYVELESEDRECLDTAVQGSENLLRMILNMLDVRRMEEGKLILHCERFNISELIEGVMDKFKTLIKQKKVEVKTEIDRKVSTWTADRSLIERVLSNLLINAMEYSPRDKEIEIASRYCHRKKQLRIEVKDFGKGVPDGFKQKIFEKFCRSEGEHAASSTGLGLTFCKLAVEAHQGTIWVESEEGEGSRFIFSLPLSRIDDLH